MRHYQTGKTYFRVPLGGAATKKYGADYLHIHRADLLTVLHDACENMGVNIHLGSSYSRLSARFPKSHYPI